MVGGYGEKSDAPTPAQKLLAQTGLDAIKEAADTGRTLTPLEAQSLIDEVYHSYKGDEKELPERSSLYENRDDYVMFSRDGVDKLDRLIGEIAHGAGIVTSTAEALVKTVKASNVNIKLWHLPGTRLPATVAPEVRELAERPIPKPLPFFTWRFDQQAYELNKQAIIDEVKSPTDKILIKKVYDAILHGSFTMLLNGLSDCIGRFNETIGSESYKTIIERGKSDEWIVQLALGLGVKPPSGLYDYAGSIDWDKKGSPYKAWLDSKVAVLFDDIAYSGTQLETQISQIIKQNSTSAIPVQKVFVIVPIMTKKAQEKILKMGRDSGIEVICITSDIVIKEFPEVLTAEETVRFRELFPGNYEATSLVVTDWKSPDSLSVPLSLFKQIVPRRIRPYNPELKEAYKS